MDLSLDCDAEAYRHYHAFALFMVLVYPVGIPAWIAASLGCCQELSFSCHDQETLLLTVHSYYGTLTQVILRGILEMFKQLWLL